MPSPFYVPPVARPVPGNARTSTPGRQGYYAFGEKKNSKAKKAAQKAAFQLWEKLATAVSKKYHSCMISLYHGQTLGDFKRLSFCRDPQNKVNNFSLKCFDTSKITQIIQFENPNLFSFLNYTNPYFGLKFTKWILIYVISILLLMNFI